MKVQIKYTVDFDKIPKEVKQRYVSLMRLMQEVLDCHRTAEVNDQNMQLFIDNCDQVRKKLYDIDVGLGDIVAISKSFLSDRLGLESSSDNKELLNG